MATNRDFQAMLNEYLPNKLLENEFKKRSWILQNVESDPNWLSGNLIVPFRGSNASSVKMGGLTDSSDIGKSKFVRGQITSQPEAWASLIFDSRDVMEHGKVSEQNFVALLDDELPYIMDYFKFVVSHQFLNGAAFATATADGDASGNLTVDRPERFVVGQKVVIDDNNSSPVTAYVNTINLATGVVNFVSTRYGATAVDLSAFTVAQAAKCYFDGGETSANRFSALKSMLLSAAAGGDATIYGQTKLAYPYLQAINSDGSSISATNVLDKIFDHVVLLRNRGAAGANKVVMSYKHWGSIMKILEDAKGPFRKASDVKTSQYGWDEVEIGGKLGSLTAVAVQELDDDFMPVLDMKAMTVHSNGMFKKHADPEGKEYYTVRAGSGYSYIVDLCFFGDLVLKAPNRCGIIHSISY